MRKTSQFDERHYRLKKLNKPKTDKSEKFYAEYVKIRLSKIKEKTLKAASRKEYIISIGKQ